MKDTILKPVLVDTSFKDFYFKIIFTCYTLNIITSRFNYKVYIVRILKTKKKKIMQIFFIKNI